MYKIVIVEDARTIREELSTFLNHYGYEVVAPEISNSIVEDILGANAHLILLDINLPLYDGYYLCREIRKVSQVPIIIVTSRNSDMDELMSMNLGADDFITKPYNTQILLARITAILKRVYGQPIQVETLQYKSLTLYLTNSKMSYGDETIELTKNELKILSYLIKNQGTIVMRESLMEVLWKSELFVDDNTLSVNVNRLRKKLEDLGLKDAIETKRGMGYTMP